MWSQREAQTSGLCIIGKPAGLDTAIVYLMTLARYFLQHSVFFYGETINEEGQEQTENHILFFSHTFFTVFCLTQ